MTDAEIHAEASRIILIAMGKEVINRGYGRRKKNARVWRADEDPLAHWSGFEAIVSLINRAAE